jgi:hypothetical protein
MYRGYLVTVEARPSGELRLRRPFPATAIAAVGTQQPAAERRLRRLRRPATQIDRPERFHVEVSDPAEMHEFPEREYGAKSRLCNRDSVRGDIEASTDPINKVVGVWVTAGRAEGHSDGIAGSATPGEVTMVAQPDMPNYTHTQGMCQISVLMDPSVVASVATGILVLADGTIATPLVLGLALSTFPNSATTGPTPHDRADNQPVLLRGAIEFIDANVIEDIGFADIAEAVHVTARAVQYMLPRHLDTTPLRYLREVRRPLPAHHGARLTSLVQLRGGAGLANRA